MNNKKITFITCVNDEVMYEECIRYINRLIIPEEYQVDKIAIRDAKSITSGYNEAMKKTDAKYKIYLHQDVFITAKDFLYDIIEVFKDGKIGMIGAAGSSNIPTSGIWWETPHAYSNVYDNVGGAELKVSIAYKEIGSVVPVKVIDGLIMATQYDIEWREELFDGWHFYDVSQSIEFSKYGYTVVLLNRKEPWIVHDCGLTTIDNNQLYHKYRKLFLDEYSKTLFPVVTIMITAYNRPKLFKIALESAINQDYVNKQIIVLDNSTNDEVVNVMNEYKQYDYIRFYKNKDELKVIDNFNKIINITTSEYICFLMDDDIYEKTKISKMVDQFIKDDRVSLVTSYRQVIDINGNKLPDIRQTRKLFDKVVAIDEEKIKKYFLLTADNFIGETTTPLFKKSLLNKQGFGFYKGKQYNVISDLVTWIHMSEYGKVIYIPNELSYFRIHQSQDQKKMNTMINGGIEISNLFIELIKDNHEVDINTVKLLVETLISTVSILDNNYEDSSNTNYSKDEMRSIIYDIYGLANKVDNQFGSEITKILKQVISKSKICSKIIEI